MTIRLFIWMRYSLCFEAKTKETNCVSYDNYNCCLGFVLLFHKKRNCLEIFRIVICEGYTKVHFAKLQKISVIHMVLEGLRPSIPQNNLTETTLDKIKLYQYFVNQIVEEQLVGNELQATFGNLRRKKIIFQSTIQRKEAAIKRQYVQITHFDKYWIYRSLLPCFGQSFTKKNALP